MKYSSQKMILFQVGIIKLCAMDLVNTPSEGAGIDSSEIANLKNRISQLEMQIAQGIRVTQSQGNSIKNNTTKMQNNVKTEEPKRVVQNIQTGEKLDTWPNIVGEFKNSGKIMLYTNLLNSSASKLNDMVIGIEFQNGLTPFAKTVLEKNENVAELEKRLSMECGKPMKVKYIDVKANSQIIEQNSNPIEAFANDMDIPFNVYE